MSNDLLLVVPEPRPGDLARFMSRVEKQPSGCWRWTGTKTGPKWKDEVKAYGAFSIRGVPYRAHRVIYVWTYGINPDVPLHQTCENSLCVNPTHIEPADQGQYRHPSLDYSRCRVGHERTPENVAADGRCRQCARESTAKYREQNREKVRARERELRGHVVHDPIVCPACGEEFTPVRSTAKVCPACREAKSDRRRAYQREYMRLRRAALRSSAG